MAASFFMGCKGYLAGEEWEMTSTEGNERAVDENSSMLSETSLPDTSERCQGSDQKLRNQHLESKIKKLTERNQCLEREIKNLKERFEEQEERHQAEAQEYSTGHKSLQRRIDELTKSLNNVRSEKQKMESNYMAKLKQLDDYSKRLSEEQTNSKRLDRDLKHYMSRLSKEESKSKDLDGKLTYSVTSFSYLRENYNQDMKKMARESDYLNSRLAKKDEELRVLREELKEKTARLAAAFEKRLKHDQRRVENTIEFNTPTDIEKDFSDFFDGDRIDACGVMESILHSEEEADVEIYYPRLACIIFVTAYEQVKEAREAACDMFANVTRWLIDETPRMGQALSVSRKKGEFSCHLPVTIGDFLGKEDIEISRDVLDGLILSLKQTAHLCSLDCFENVVKEIVLERWDRYLQEEKTQLLPAVQVCHAQEMLTQLSDYIKACIRLAWRMVTQVPPLQLEYKSLKFDKAVHKLARFQCNSDDQRFSEAPGENIACYLWPALLEGGGRIIFSGEVLCKWESNFMDYVHL